MALIGLDTSRFPLVIVTPPASVTNEELATFLERYANEVYARRQRYVTILDLRRSGDMPAAQRKMITDRMQQKEEAARLFAAGNVMIFDSALMRALLTAILWVRRPPTEMKIASTLEEAIEYARGFLTQKRVA